MSENKKNESDDKIIERISDLLPKESFGGGAENSGGLWQKVKRLFEYAAKKENSRHIACILIPGFMLFMLLVNIVVPPFENSLKDGRKLIQFPEFSYEKFIDGSFSDEFEVYVSEQFVFENQLISVKRRMESLFGKKENNGVLFCDDGYLIENTSSLKKENTKRDFEALKKLASLKRYDITLAILPPAYETMQKKLPSFAYTDVYMGLIGDAESALESAEIKIADMADVIKKNNEDYLYCRTDSRITAHGGYIAYSALGDYLAYKPLSKDEFDVEKVASDYYGDLWRRSGFADAKPDEICSYNLKKQYEYEVISLNNGKKLDSLYDSGKLKTGDKCAYYLGENTPAIVVKSNCPSKKRLAVIGDSNSRMVVPFLANHFKEIHLIDPEGYDGDILEYLYNCGVKDVLVLYNHNAFIAQSGLGKISDDFKNSPYNIVPGVKYGIVPELDKVDDSYFEDAVFVGDSLTLGFGYYSGLDSVFLCESGLSTENIQKEKLIEEKTVIDILSEEKHVNKIYIMLGMNEAEKNDAKGFAKRYSEFIDSVRETLPNAIIYVESITPVSKKYEKSHKLNNKIIKSYNEQLVKMAKEKNCYYVDLYSYVADADGFLPDGAGNDGVHLSSGNYLEVAGYLKKHAVVNVKDGGKKKTSKSIDDETAADSSGPMVALTFDDGPLEGSTERILSVLEKNNAKGTFFVVGSNVMKNPDIIRKMHKIGCQIGNHSFSHADLSTLTTDGVASQIGRTSNAVRNITGEYTDIIRPPYGTKDKSALAKTEEPFILWSIDTYDWLHKDTDRVIKEVLENASDGDIILMHDIYETTADAVEKIVPGLIKKGFRLVTVEEMYKYKNVPLEAHNIYNGIK